MAIFVATTGDAIRLAFIDRFRDERKINNCIFRCHCNIYKSASSTGARAILHEVYTIVSDEAVCAHTFSICCMMHV